MEPGVDPGWNRSFDPNPDPGRSDGRTRDGPGVESGRIRGGSGVDPGVLSKHVQTCMELKKQQSFRQRIQYIMISLTE